eukprot:6324036-Pyramimonas_sp.AAC.1
MSAPTIFVENRYPSLSLLGLRTAGHAPPLRRPCQQPLDSDRGMAAHDPVLAARCMLHCLLSGM